MEFGVGFRGDGGDGKSGGCGAVDGWCLNLVGVLKWSESGACEHVDLACTR